MNSKDIIIFFEEIPNIEYCGIYRNEQNTRDNYLKGLLNVNNTFNELIIILNNDDDITIFLSGNETIDLTNINSYLGFGNTLLPPSLEIKDIKVKKANKVIKSFL